MKSFWAGLSLITVLVGYHAPAAATPDRPNVVFILTDNHGAWTMGCYGNPDIKTPHVDRMAAEGIRFDQAYTNNAVCSPTRATYLTGLMPSQHGVHCFLRGAGLQTGPEPRNTLDQFTSLPEVLKSNGYACGLVGKWHLGNNLQPNEGLDDYWITTPHGGTSTFHGAKVIENGEIRNEETYLTDFWTQHALKFIDENQKQPFFLYLAYNGPYGLSAYQLKSSDNRHADFYADKDMASFPRGVIHPWQRPNRAYFGNLTSMRRYGEELSAVDDGVGAVLAKLKDLGLDENTLVVFTADQGWAGGQHGIWGMGDHTRPVNALEYSMRIPLVFRQPGSIPAGQVSDLATSNYDFMPTVLGYLGLEDDMPTTPKSPGRDYSDELRGKRIDAEQWGDAVYYEFESLRCVRAGGWKLVDRFHDDDYHELYDLTQDPDEAINLYNEPAHAEKRRDLQSQLDAFFSEHTTDTYDLWNGGGSQTALHVWGKTPEEERTAAIGSKRPFIPSAIDPAWNPAPIELPDGLVAEVAAAPPLVQHPIMATLDDRGRLFVCENAGLNLNKEELAKQKPNSIRVLEDLNDDGLYDRSTVFADDLTFPQGALWLDEALYVMSPPSLWRFEDTDGDNVADVREELVTGFGYTGNAADVHGPFLHPSGRLFWCHGRKGHKVVDPKTGNLVSKNKGARIWSCRPDGSDLQVFAGGGMDNPVELVFSPAGDVIGDVNLFYGRPRGDVLVHWLEGGAYPRFDQQAVIDEFTRTGPLLEEIHNFGHVAVSGITLATQRDSVVPNRAGGNALDLLATHFNTQKITHTVLQPEGSTWREERTETLLRFDDPDVHLTDILEDANGDLLVLDTGGWFRIGCPTSQIAKPDVSGAIYRIRHAGKRVAPVYPAAMEIPGDSAAGVKDREILLGGALEAEFIHSRITQESKQQGLWELSRIQSDAATSLLLKALSNDDAQIRQTACAALRWRPTDSTNAIEVALIDRLVNDEAAVSRAAANALGFVGGPAAAASLLELLKYDSLDREHQHAALYALISINEPNITRAALKSGFPNQQAAAWLALDQMPAGDLEAAELIPLLTSEVAELQETAIAIASRHPEWATAISAHFSQTVGEKPLSEIETTAFRALVPPNLGNPGTKDLITKLLADSSFASVRVRLACELIANSDLTQLDPDWIAGFTTALSSNDAEILEGALDALGQARTDQFDRQLRSIADDPERSTLLRVRALRAAAGSDKALSPEAFTLLSALLSPDASPQDRLSACQMLGKARLTTTQLLEVAKLTRHAGPLGLPALLTAFMRTKVEEVGQALASALPESSGIGNIHPTDLQRLMSRFSTEIYTHIQPTIDELLEREQQKLERIAALEPLLSTGDADRGLAAFKSGKGACLTCHRIGEVGQAIGPDLSTIGRIRSGRDLLESILYPSESLARDFETWTVELVNGPTYVGLIQRETADTVYLTTPAAEEIPIQRSNVKSITAIPMSLMPQGLDQSMNQQDLLDLIAFLRANK